MSDYEQIDLRIKCIQLEAQLGDMVLRHAASTSEEKMQALTKQLKTTLEKLKQRCAQAGLELD